MNKSANFILLLFLIVISACAPKYSRINPIPAENQSSFFKQGRHVVVSRQANSIVTMAPAQEAFPEGTRPTFIITVNNLSNEPLTFSTEDIFFNVNEKELRVFSYQELVQEIEQQRRSAATTQALIGAFGVLGASMDGGKTYHSGTYQNQNTLGTYSGTSYSSLRTLQAQTTVGAMTSNNIAKINNAAEQQLISVQNTILRKETVPPNTWYGGYVETGSLENSESHTSIKSTVKFGGDIHHFSFVLSRDGETTQKTRRSNGEIVAQENSATQRLKKKQKEVSSGTSEQEKTWAENLKKRKKEAENGDLEAQYQLGMNYSDGIGVHQDDKKAVEWLRKAADQGHMMAQHELGQMYSEGKGVHKNMLEAAKWFEKAAEQGHILAQSRLGFMYKNGEGVQKDYGLAAKWFKQIEEQNPKYAASMGFTLGNLFNSIAYRYYTGEGEPLNFQKAKYWYEKAAANNCLSAYTSLGMMYYSGKGVEKDYTKAMAWFEKAAEKGYTHAYVLLGMMYYDGIAVKKNYQRAADWFKMAADKGIAEAQFRLGLMYMEGKGVELDYNKSLSLFHLAAENSSAQGTSTDAQIMLGNIYRKGLGVNRNYTEARKWYSLAAEKGDSFAIKSLAEMLENEVFPEWEYLASNNKIGIVLINPKKIRREGRYTWFWLIYVPYQDTEHPEIVYTMGYHVADCAKGTTGIAAYYDYGSDNKLLNSHSIDPSEIQLTPAIPGTIGDSKLSYICASTKGKSNENWRADNKKISFGTGWPSALGLVVTNNHVVSGHDKISLIRTDGKRITATVTLRDESNDLALLQPKDWNFLPPALPLSESAARTGASVLTMGYPHPDIMGSKPKLSEGIVSATYGAGDDPRVLQISVPVQAGNSGGPLLNMKGEVVGVVMGKLNAVKMLKLTGDLPQNVNYAIKIPYLRGLLSSASTKNLIEEVKMKNSNSIEIIASRITDSILLVVAE